MKPTDEFSDLPLRVAEITKEQRLRRESQYQEHRGSTVVTNGGGKWSYVIWPGLFSLQVWLLPRGIMAGKALMHTMG